MTTKNYLRTMTFSLTAVFVLSFGFSESFAQEEPEGYNYADGIKPIVTFHFKDGIETHEFPVFIMEDDYIANESSPSFSLQGTVDNTPYLHKALDEAYKYRQSLSFDWDYKYFDVYVDLTKGDSIIETLRYSDCKISDYAVVTVDDDFESYTSSKTGFAMIDDIEFLCSGLNLQNFNSMVGYSPDEIVVNTETNFGYAQEVRTFVEFQFDQGTERIEFPVFVTESGFEESTSNVVPEFKVEGLVTQHPLLSKAIDNARKVGNFQSGSNIDFESTVEFVQNGTVLRSLDYKDCRVGEYEIKTQFDKEEGWTGKRGFAVTEVMHVECIGLDGMNPRYDDVYPDKSWKNNYVQYESPAREYSLADGVYALATFEFDNGKEISMFPEFDQHDILDASRPSLTLTGIVGDHPQLYEKVDENLDVSFTTGSNNFIELFGIDIKVIRNDATIRAFEYNDCRVVDYNIKTEEDNEQSYFKEFALTNEFDFECHGYSPYNPLYENMFEIEKLDMYSSADYQQRQLDIENRQAGTSLR